MTDKAKEELVKRDDIIRWLRTEWQLEPMDAQDVSLIILDDRKRIIERVMSPLETWLYSSSSDYKVATELVNKAISICREYL